MRKIQILVYRRVPPHWRQAYARRLGVSGHGQPVARTLAPAGRGTRRHEVLRPWGRRRTARPGPGVGRHPHQRPSPLVPQVHGQETAAPRFDGRRHATVGAIGRACCPTSKRGWWEWARATSCAYLLRQRLDGVDSQHFWDLMDALPVEAIEPLESQLFTRSKPWSRWSRIRCCWTPPTSSRSSPPPMPAAPWPSAARTNSTGPTCAR